MPESAITVFIVDDDPSVRVGLARLLRSKGLRSVCFPSAGEFLVQPPHEGLGCMILDVCMPGMDGFALQGLLLDRQSELPVIFLTGHGDIPMSVQAIRRGASDFLTKPIDERTLMAAIERAVNIQQAQRQTQGVRTLHRVRLATLTAREREVLTHVLRGARNRQIAATMGICEKTVKVHRGRVMEKMSASTLVELVQSCAKHGTPLDS